jgi:predicted O-methyltransferase YrrM
MTIDEKCAINKIIKRKFMKRIITAVEIGSYLGASSCFIAAAISNDSKLYCIDTWQNDAMKYVDADTDADERDTYREFLLNTKKYSKKIVMIRKWSTEAIDDVKQKAISVDFLFIDGDHSYEGVKKDWDLYSKLLKPGSIVVFHDTGWAEGVKKVITEDVIGISSICIDLPNMQGFTIKCI